MKRKIAACFLAGVLGMTGIPVPAAATQTVSSKNTVSSVKAADPLTAIQEQASAMDAQEQLEEEEEMPAQDPDPLVLDNGIRLMDSSLILNYFEAQADPERRLLPVAPDAQANDLQTLGFILAAAEKAVQNVYEHNLRPVEKQHVSWVERITIQLLAACREWNTLLEGRPATAVPDQVAVTSTVVWTFIQSMIPQVVNAADFRTIQAFAESFESQSAFKKYPFN